MNALEYIAATVEPSGLHNFEAAVLHALRSAGCTLGAQDKITHHWYKRLVDNIGLELEFLHTDDPKVPQVASIKVHLLGAAIAVDDIDVNDGPKAYKQPIRDAMRMLSMFCLAPEEFERSYKWLADRLTSRIAAQGDNMAAIRSRVAHAFHLNRVTATVEPADAAIDIKSRMLQLARVFGTPHVVSHSGGRNGFIDFYKIAVTGCPLRLSNDDARGPDGGDDMNYFECDIDFQDANGRLTTLLDRDGWARDPGQAKLLEFARKVKAVLKEQDFVDKLARIADTYDYTLNRSAAHALQEYLAEHRQ